MFSVGVLQYLDIYDNFDIKKLNIDIMLKENYYTFLFFPVLQIFI